MVKHNTNTTGLPILYGSVIGAVLLSILVPLTSGRVLQLLNPAIVRGEYEPASTSHWKYGFGFICSLGILFITMSYEMRVLDAMPVWLIYLLIFPCAGFVGVIIYLFKRLPLRTTIVIGFSVFGLALVRMFMLGLTGA